MTIVFVKLEECNYIVFEILEIKCSWDNHKKAIYEGALLEYRICGFLFVCARCVANDQKRA